jgi:hypothetical protein
MQTFIDTHLTHDKLRDTIPLLSVTVQYEKQRFLIVGAIRIHHTPSVLINLVVHGIFAVFIFRGLDAWLQEHRRMSIRFE